MLLLQTANSENPKENLSFPVCPDRMPFLFLPQTKSKELPDSLSPAPFSPLPKGPAPTFLTLHQHDLH